MKKNTKLLCPDCEVKLTPNIKLPIKTSRVCHIVLDTQDMEYIIFYISLE